MRGVPQPWEAIILVAAAWRTWVLLSRDAILDPLRDLIFLDPDGEPKNDKALDFLECPYCAGWWIALAWWGAWAATGWTLVAAVPLALSAGLVLIEKYASGE